MELWRRARLPGGVRRRCFKGPVGESKNTKQRCSRVWLVQRGGSLRNQGNQESITNFGGLRRVAELHPKPTW